MTRWAAMLRGVNLGGRKLLMDDLARTCTALGLTEVRTLLASGNVVFAAEGEALAVERALEAALADQGLVTDALLRNRAELVEAMAANPFTGAALNHPSHLLVTFHREAFPAEALERLSNIHCGPERLHAAGHELFIDFGGREGMRASTLLQSMRKARFPTVATGRNWNTVAKLAAALA